jgi:Icc-related predicted phosphoesterase
MTKKGLRLLFAADIHGNTTQYMKIFNKAVDDRFDAIILGGDLCPKGAFMGSMDVQREFLITYLIPRLEELSQIDNPPDVYIMMGNDDWAGNLDVLEEQNEKILKMLDKNIYPLDFDYFITGYPYVPLTPFRIKDWEKWDLSELNDIEHEKNVLLHGIQSREKCYESKNYNPEDRDDCIQNDMKGLFKGTNPKKTIFVFHAPPYNTYLDMLYTKEHIGSAGIRMGIERYQPLLTLHSHIHETVDISEEFLDKIKNTICASVGNHFTQNDPYVLTIDLPSFEIRRIKLI